MRLDAIAGLSCEPQRVDLEDNLAQVNDISFTCWPEDSPMYPIAKLKTKLVSAACAAGMLGCLTGCQSQVAAAETPVAEPVIALPDCETGPVFMVVAGETLDLERMIVYSKKLRETGLYPALQGYYINSPRPIRVYEGTLPENYAHLIVRFPSVCASDAFWYSEAYQKDVKPLRETPSAGNYTVTVYSEIDLPDYMADKLDGAMGLYKTD